MRCVSACPKGIIEMVPQTAMVKIPCSSRDKGALVRKYCEAGCIACKLCEKSCPHDAVKVIDNHAVIDYDSAKTAAYALKNAPES